MVLKHRWFTALLLAALLTFGLAACAGKSKDGIIIYPSPPEEPRVVYLTSYQGFDAFRERSFLDVIFGDPVEAKLMKPWGVFARDGKIYATDTGTALVMIFDTVGKTVRTVGTGGTGSLALPLGVAMGSNGILYVSDGRLKKVFGFDAEGKLKFGIGQPGELQNPTGIAINDELGRMYIADSYGHVIRVYSLAGEKLFDFGIRGEKDGQFNYPTNVCVNRTNGQVYVTDTQNFRVQVFDKDGVFVRKIGQLGDVPGTFSRPKVLAVDSEDHLYVTDAAFNNVQLFDKDGQLLLIFGGFGTGPGELQLPAGMHIDDQDKIYIVDQVGGRVLVFQYLSEKWKAANPQDYETYKLKP